MKVLCAFLGCIVFSSGASILGVFNHPGQSHTFLGKILLRNLAKRGHEVVMISSFPLDEPIANYTDINLPELLADLKERNKQNHLSSLSELINMTLEHTEQTFQNEQVKLLIESNRTFDVVLVDWFYNDATLIFGHIFKAPVIYMSSFGNMALLNDFSGNVLPFSYVPGAGLLTSDDMSFAHRFVMTLVNVGSGLYKPRKHRMHYEILKRHFTNPPTIEQLKENVALVLSNSHFSFETPRPYTPNIIPVGGFHIEKPPPLPEDLKRFFDSARDGVIYFSLGSQLKLTNFNGDLFTTIMNAFSKVKQKVLIKNDDNARGAPDNIKVVNWAPQLGILAHPNLKLFITHCGMLSTAEAIHFGVPMICIPNNGDQLTNAAFVQSRNIGLHISADEITEDTLVSMINKIVSDKRYQEEMNYRSALLKEQPIQPLDLAIYWVEHVIKHKHGNHLKTFATKLPWYKYYLIDIIGLLLCILLLALYLIFLLVKGFVNTACKLSTKLIKIKKS